MRRTTIFLLAALCAPAVADAVATDARSAGMGGVLIPGRDLHAANPAWHRMELPDESRMVLPIPLGVVSGFTTDTDGMNDFEKWVTRLQESYPFFEMELRPEPRLNDDLVIEVGEDYFSIDLGEGSQAIPSEAVDLNLTETTSLMKVGAGPLFVGLNALMHTEGMGDMDDELRQTLQTGQPFAPGESYGAVSDLEGQVALSLEIGTAIGLGTWNPGEGEGWTIQAGGAVKGLLGLGYADTHVDADMTTGDPIFDDANSLDVTYVADLRFNRSPGLGMGLNLGLATAKGPWMIGLGAENIATFIDWKTERRIEERLDTGESVTTVIARDEKVRAWFPVTGVANAAYMVPGWLVAGDLRVNRNDISTHAGLERRVGLFAVRTGLSWSQEGGMQGALGAGIGSRALSFDVSARTHPYAYSNGRGVYLGASVGLAL